MSSPASAHSRRCRAQLSAAANSCTACGWTRPALEFPSPADADDYYAVIAAIAGAANLPWPPPLDGIPDGTMLAVAAVPGKILEEWRHAGFGTWIAWPHAADAVHAEEMTAGQLRTLLAARDHG